MNIKFRIDHLAAEENNYVTKIVTAYIVYDLDNWPYNRLKKFLLKSHLFGGTSIVKNSDKKVVVYWL